MEFKSVSMTILEFIDKWRRGEIEIDPDIQRKAVWNQKYKVGLIDTIIKGYPIPLIFLTQKIYDVGENKKKQVFSIVDGQQRMRALKEFLDGKYQYVSDKGNPFRESAENELHGKRYNELPSNVQDRIDSYDLPLTKMVNHTNENAGIMFERLNKNVVKVSQQELRNSRYGGVFKTFIYSDECKKLFKTLFDYSVFKVSDETRMKDVEYLSDLCYALKYGITDYKSSDLDTFYFENEDMETDALRKMKGEIKKVVNTVANIFKQGTPKLTRFTNKHDFYTLFMVALNIQREGRVLNHKDQFIAIYDTLEKFNTIVFDESESNMGLNYLQAVTNRQSSKSSRLKRDKILSDLILPIVPESKDTKRSFSESQRKLKWCLSTDKICALCGKVVDEDDYELDHIKAHSKGGRTTLSNAQITHRKCNRSKGAK